MNAEQEKKTDEHKENVSLFTHESKEELALANLHRSTSTSVREAQAKLAEAAALKAVK